MLNVLITGIASGIGKAVKDYFLLNKHRVYGIDLFEVESEENLFTYVADIKDEDRLLSICSKFKQNSIEFDVIINIAGVHKMASLVESDFKDIKNLIDINLLGTMLVNNIFHPVLKEKGRIIIITSEVAGFDPMPFNGLYNVSKTGLDCYAQALRQELNLIGQKVITVRPGSIKTPLANNSINDTEKLAKSTKLYSKQAKNFSNIAKKFMGKPMEPSKIAKLIYKVSIKKRPKLIYSIHHNIGLVLLNILPKRLQCFIIKMILN